jgi:cell division inhibitor SulA/protein ImuA
MRAATALFSLFSSGGAPIWRADERPADEAVGPTLTSGFAELDRELPGGGWPQGQLTELLLDDAGIGELSLLAPALVQLAQVKRSTVWVLPPDGTRGVEGQALPYAPALAAAGVDLARTIFVQPATPREGLWAIEQALRAQHLGAVIGWLPPAGTADSDFKALRRLHLLAQRHSALAFVLRSTRHASAPSPAALRLQLASDGRALEATVLKRRGRPLLEPIALTLHPAHWTTAQVVTDAIAPKVQPASRTALLAARSLQALLDH